MLKRKTSCVVCLVLALVFSLMVCVSAEEHDYIRFTQVSRMESNGHFTFDFHYSCKSDEFTANASSIRIDTCAKIYHMSNSNDVYTDSSKKFRVTLCKKNLIGYTEIGSYVGNADGVYGGKTFTNISEGSTYYFNIDPVDDNFDTTGYYFVGYGDVTNVTVN